MKHLPICALYTHRWEFYSEQRLVMPKAGFKEEKVKDEST